MKKSAIKLLLMTHIRDLKREKRENLRIGNYAMAALCQAQIEILAKVIIQINNK